MFTSTPREGTRQGLDLWYAELDQSLYETVIRWFDDAWPITHIDYAPHQANRDLGRNRLNAVSGRESPLPRRAWPGRIDALRFAGDPCVRAGR